MNDKTLARDALRVIHIRLDDELSGVFCDPHERTSEYEYISPNDMQLGDELCETCQRKEKHNERPVGIHDR